MADVWRGRVRGDSGFSRRRGQADAPEPRRRSRSTSRCSSRRRGVGSSCSLPNVAEVHDFVHDRGNYYMVLEWIDGVDLGTGSAGTSRKGEQTRWELVAAVGVGILRGLAAAHERVEPDGAVAAGRPPRRVAAQRAAHDARHGEADRLRPRARARSRAGDHRARHREGQDVVSRAGDRRRGGRPMPARRISSRAARCCGRRSSVASCSTARPTTRPTCRLRDCMVQPLRPLRPDVPPPFVADHPARAVRQRRPAVPVGARDGAPDRHRAQEGPAPQGPPHRARQDRRRGARRDGPGRARAIRRRPRRSRIWSPEELTPPAGIAFPPVPVEEKRGLRYRLPQIFGWKRG